MMLTGTLGLKSVASRSWVHPTTELSSRILMFYVIIYFSQLIQSLIFLNQTIHIYERKHKLTESQETCSVVGESIYIITTSGTSQNTPKLVYVASASVEPNIVDFMYVVSRHLTVSFVKYFDYYTIHFCGLKERQISSNCRWFF